MHEKSAQIIVFFMILVPTLFTGIRGAFVCICVALFFLTKAVFRVHIGLFIVTSAMMLCSAFALARGWLNGHFEASFLLFYIFGPVFVAYIATIFGSPRGLVAFQQTILLACVMGSGITLLLWLVPNFSAADVELRSVLQFTSGTVMGVGKISIPFLSSIMFGIPFVTFKVMCRRPGEPLVLPIVGLTLMIAVAFLSGRTAAHAVLAGSFLLLILHFSLVNFKFRPLLLVMLGLFLGSICLIFVVPDWFNRSLEIAVTKITMEENETLNSHRRAEIISSLLPLFFDSPLAGQGIGFSEIGGLGATSFEIVWLQILVSFGLPLSIIMACCTSLVWLRVASRPLAANQASQNLWPWFYAWALFMLVNFSNPLMLMFDSLWILAVPAVLWMASKKNAAGKVSISKHTAQSIVAPG